MEAQQDTFAIDGRRHRLGGGRDARGPRLKGAVYSSDDRRYEVTCPLCGENWRLPAIAVQAGLEAAYAEGLKRIELAELTRHAGYAEGCTRAHL